jgi:formylglycine-generating enzyme required for sulfatase activity
VQIAGAYPEPGAAFRDRQADGGPCGDCPEMVIVPAGGFTMGATIEEEEREQVPREWARRAQPLTEVEIGRPFAIGRTHVTVAQYAAFAAATGRPDAPGCAWRAPGFEAHDDDPVVCVTFDDAQDYARWLSERTAYAYRLPSEAEWEYAARAGTRTARWWGEAIGRGNANCYDCGSRWDNRSTAPVASFSPNAFGLYDMLGNAWQFVADCWNESLAGRPRAERAVTTGNCNGRPVRGGAWDSGTWSVRAGHRDWSGAGNRDNDTGFRVVRTLPGAGS